MNSRNPKVKIFDGIWKDDLARRKWSLRTLQRRANSGEYLTDKVSGSRTLVFQILIIAISIVFLGRLFFLTIVHGSENRTLAENNRIRLVAEEAPRGKIFARDGQLLASSAMRFFLENGQNRVEITESQAKELTNSGLAGENFVGELGEIKREAGRSYSLSSAAGHAVGYTSLVQKEDLLQNSKITSGDFVGRLGVEEAYDGLLRGVDGKKIIEVDNVGKIISVIGESPATAGADIFLTLDYDLQKKAYEVLKSQLDKLKLFAGAVIVTQPSSGQVLALVSFPSFDPANIGRSVANEKKPLFDRAVSGEYPPGSVFKISSAFAGLESGKISKDTEIEDVGEFSLGDTKFSNWFYTSYGGRDGVLKIDRAIARSNDIFFYRVGERTGVSDLRQMALKLGFGQKTGIDIPGEGYGLVGDEVWKKAKVGDNWFLGDTMHMAIGQGFVLTTPIQINRVTDFVANGGKLPKPYLVKKIKQPNGEEIKINDSVGDLLVKSENLAIVRDGMRMACEKGGTAWPFFDAKYKVGCKTGTAEKSQGNPHAWFTVFAPFDDPQIAMTVIIEDGGEGSTNAAPVAREISDWYFSRNVKP